MKTIEERLKIIENEINELKKETKHKSILEGKITISVNNERELKLLMKHYEGNGWMWSNGDKPMKDIGTIISELPTTIYYGDRFYYGSISGTRNITFDQIASEIGIKVPVFDMKSEDGIDLYEGDHFYIIKDGSVIGHFILKNWPLKGHEITPDKAFSTREAAEAWIEEQNKPKEIEVLSRFGYKFIADDAGIKIIKPDTNNFYITTEELSQMLDACKSFQHENTD